MLLAAQAEGVFVNRSKPVNVKLVPCPSGTGQMITLLNEGSLDVCVALTEGLVAGLCRGATSYSLVGQYVSSPLVWGIFAGKDAKYNTVKDTAGTTVGISRFTSGSEIMARYLADKEGFKEFDFKVLNNIDGLIGGVNDGSASMFMWETFTTKPFVDAGKVREIGQCPTPWPSWTIAKHQSADSETIKEFLNALNEAIAIFEKGRSDGSSAKFIESHFEYKAEDVQGWLKTVTYPSDVHVLAASMLENVMTILTKANAIPKKIAAKDLVGPEATLA